MQHGETEKLRTERRDFELDVHGQNLHLSRCKLHPQRSSRLSNG